MKNVEPYIPSDIENVASTYSYACKAVDVKAKNKVRNNPSLACSFLPTMISWCARVMVAPGGSNVNVLSNGTPHGLKGFILFGGHTDPISTVGDKLEWKKAQKRAGRNITSETMNKIIPERRPCCTVLVWKPLNVASLTTSLHHTHIPLTTITNPNNNILSPF